MPATPTFLGGAIVRPAAAVGTEEEKGGSPTLLYRVQSVA